MMVWRWSVLSENSFVLRGELLGALMLKGVVKNQMKMEKKLVAWSILAIVIGVASIIARASTPSFSWAHSALKSPFYCLAFSGSASSQT